METFSWPQTSLLLRPEPTSSSLSVVKTADLGISSTEYRETISPATVYHSPSNWLLTTPSSTAESDTVKPMLAPSTTTGKDKTSLHPSNTMLIKKSTSNEIRLESTDYRLSGQITSSYKTKSQQTTAVPEILPPGEGEKFKIILEASESDFPVNMKYQEQSNYSSLLHQKKTEQWTNSQQLSVICRKGEKNRAHKFPLALVLLLIGWKNNDRARFISQSGSLTIAMA